MADGHDAAIYNIKAVSRLTGIAPDTLRRWESRYEILSPQRSGGGYRMYSQRDVDTILWLKARVAEGLTISRACELLRTRPDLGPAANGAVPGGGAVTGVQPGPPAAAVRALPTLVGEVLRHLGRLEEAPAAQLMSEAVSLYPVEQVVEELIYPALVEVGELWRRGEWTVAQEHFASAIMRGRLANMLHSSPFNPTGRLVLVACAPDELHEIGALIMALYLRRSGYRVIYLGQNVPLDTLVSISRTLRPVVVCCSASRPETASNLRPLAGLAAELQRQTGYQPLLAYGGSIFNRHPQLAEQLGGRYLGASARDAVRQVQQIAV
ncbi:MAG TPA: B12-binding domain-containing protein [Chloroflexia bacterium]|nr:B12-binding domain-containing protein [Chloroflexia bacterium]